MYENVEKIINNWDPVELFPLAPKDEYSQEVNKIIAFLKKNPDVDTEELTRVIRGIFVESFGENLLFKDNEKEVAKKILNLL